MKKINLDKFEILGTGISKNVANFILEGAKVCLSKNGHSSGVNLKISGEIEEEIILEWDENLSETILNSWKDQNELTEYAATFIGVLIINLFTDFVVTRRNDQKETCDYYLGKKFFNGDRGLLEISGIFKESSSNSIEARINRKENELKSDEIDEDELAIFIVVTEFSKPKSKIRRI